jgi:hypothetical protein
VSETLAVSSPPPAADMAVRRIPDGWPPRDDPKPACLDGNDCGRPVPPTRPVSYPEPPRRGPRP